jgi:serine/threonine-protein kinase RsbT
MSGQPTETIELRTEDDIVVARTAARELASTLEFSLIDKTRIATAISELARNTLVHGGGGMELRRRANGAGDGIHCVFVDQGKGVPDIERALGDSFTTSNGLGQGLPGSERLMDELIIESEPGKGTRVEVTKWK